MVMQWIERITGTLEHKKRYRSYKARLEQLPDPYRAAIEAVDRYLMGSGSVSNGETLVTMLEDLADLFEQSVASGTPVRAIVGENPVDFAEAFLQNYSEGQWNDNERKRLADAIDRAEGIER